MRSFVPVALLAGAMVIGSAPAAVVPEPISSVAQAAQAKKSTLRAKKRLPARTARPVLRPVSSIPGVIPPRQEFVMPNPNFPPYNSGTVAPMLPPARDPIVPGVGPVPQLPSIRPETYGDRVVRCTHQATAFNVPADQRAIYQHRCSIGH
jgi:hypothetical protein